MRTDSLQERKQTLVAQLETADEPPPLLHPSLANLYRPKVEELAAALQRLGHAQGLISRLP